MVAYGLIVHLSHNLRKSHGRAIAASEFQIQLSIGTKSVELFVKE